MFWNQMKSKEGEKKSTD